jgi:hypothetical protein
VWWLFGFGKRKPGENFAALEDAVCKDATRVFAALTKARPGERIYGFAFCADDDGMSFYVMGETMEGRLAHENRNRTEPFALEALKPTDFFYSPADWTFSDPGTCRSSLAIMEAIWSASPEGEFEETQAKVLRAIVNGLKRFDASGAFAGAMPRDAMVLTLWITDPSHPEWVLQWARELNPPQAFAWFEAGYPYEAEPPDA